MAGDREACLRAGMNDYIAKPFDPPQLLGTVRRWLDGAPRTAVPEGRAEPFEESDNPDIDSAHLDALAATVGEAILAGLLGDYLAGESERVAQIEALAALGDLRGLARLAHDLTSIAGNFGARRLERLARRLERACLAEERGTIGTLVDDIRNVTRAAYDGIARRIARG
jgi:HPt (histidine-containing phosphotransfer) domain-containing protein